VRKKNIVVAKLWFPCQYAVLKVTVSRCTTKSNLRHGSGTEFVSGLITELRLLCGKSTLGLRNYGFRAGMQF